ncbi:FliI/YscN family ATPase [uncultured Umboniibacter sp.]|uniref:FliI/YscN family ATPase n=1 Tax=uncultured Umboniibacter sp. TaxID=1798917 RepID=UPI00261183D2|nr:FliI/YscN family ATPase [uncultured Umboniibacter sp.]
MDLSAQLTTVSEHLNTVTILRPTFKVIKSDGFLIVATGENFCVGDVCDVSFQSGSRFACEVVGFDGEFYRLIPYQHANGAHFGGSVHHRPQASGTGVGFQLLGRAVNGLGEAIDGLGQINYEEFRPNNAAPPSLIKRRGVEEVMETGVKAIDSLLTLGRGQRIGLVAGSGVGKSVLLNMITRFSDVDVVVVGLVGERGREVGDFIAKTLTPEMAEKAVIIAATAEESPVMRVAAARRTHAVAEYYRDQGKNVLLLMDSLTRVGMAQREIGLALNEAPISKGYPASVFSLLNQLIERACNGESEQGSLTAIYTVLAEGDDAQDPLVDSARAILDGHIMLSRDLASQGQYPAIDIPASISRCMNDLVSEDHLQLARKCRRMISLFREVGELIPLGAYVSGVDAERDEAINLDPAISTWLQQAPSTPMDATTGLNELQALLSGNGKAG